MVTGVISMDAARYHSDPCPVPSLSNSIANVLLNRSPAHAKLSHPRLNPNFKPTESSRFDLGTAAHDLILEGGTQKICVIDPQDYPSRPTKADPNGSIPAGWTNKAIREARDMARSRGLVPLLPWEDAQIRNMVRAAFAFIAESELAGIFAQGKPEQTLIWREGETWCRSRLDWLSNDRTIILDYKTCQSAEPEAFIRHLGAMNYDLQSAFYTRGVQACTDSQAPDFVFFAQEITPPYLCSLVSLSAAYKQIAEAKYRRAVDLWGQCLESDIWQGYPSRICYAEPPAWALREFEDHEADTLTLGD